MAGQIPSWKASPLLCHPFTPASAVFLLPSPPHPELKDYAAPALTGHPSLSLGFETKKVEITLRMAGAGMWAGERVETMFIANTPKALASRLCKAY